MDKIIVDPVIAKLDPKYLDKNGELNELGQMLQQLVRAQWNLHIAEQALADVKLERDQFAVSSNAWMLRTNKAEQALRGERVENARSETDKEREDRNFDQWSPSS